MNTNYGRNLDLNLLRVFVIVAKQGSVTAAASHLYLTQPAVSAALRRLQDTVGAPLFLREGRGLALTPRGQHLFREARVHLAALIDAAFSPAEFDPLTSEGTFRLGLSDASESWLLPALLRSFEQEAPRMRFVALPVQFRTVAKALTTHQVDVAVTVADDMPAGTRRMPIFQGEFVCLFDPRHARIKKRVTAKSYFDHDHVIVSYNGDLRGIVEDALGRNRRVRCSVASFNSVGAVVDGTAMLATVPAVVARQIVELRPHLRTAPLPLTPALRGTPVEMLWRAADDDDASGRFVRERIIEVAQRMGRQPALRGMSSRGKRANRGP